ncbi:hypothetical protein DAI22_10g076800 [Oryza sativa Japonica Group]|nr:hypothetical protein DAI22_10g076800 [Oryza sativa Japonica Group]
MRMQIEDDGSTGRRGTSSPQESLFLFSQLRRLSPLYRIPPMPPRSFFIGSAPTSLMCFSTGSSSCPSRSITTSS